MLRFVGRVATFLKWTFFFLAEKKNRVSRPWGSWRQARRPPTADFGTQAVDWSDPAPRPGTWGPDLGTCLGVGLVFVFFSEWNLDKESPGCFLVCRWTWRFFEGCESWNSMWVNPKLRSCRSAWPTIYWNDIVGCFAFTIGGGSSTPTNHQSSVSLIHCHHLFEKRNASKFNLLDSKQKPSWGVLWQWNPKPVKKWW